MVKVEPRISLGHVISTVSLIATLVGLVWHTSSVISGIETRVQTHDEVLRRLDDTYLRADVQEERERRLLQAMEMINVRLQRIEARLNSK